MIAGFSLIQIPNDAGFSPIQHNSDLFHFRLSAPGPPTLIGFLGILLLFASAIFSSYLPHLTEFVHEIRMNSFWHEKLVYVTNGLYTK